jgi:predicted transcriptional regulator
MYKLEPEIIERIKLIAKEQDRTESSVVNEFLFKSTRTRQERIEAAHATYHTLHHSI